MTSKWLRLIRIHTSSLTQGAVLLGLALAGTRTWIWWVSFALFAIFYHAAGFLANNIRDYPFDRQDNAKSHFPLVSGEISLLTAKRLCSVLFLLTILIGITLSLGKPISLFFLSSSLGFAALYNFRSKTDLFSPIYIALALISLPLFSYFSTAKTLSPGMLLTTVYLFFLMLYQIGVEGYMKDIDSDRLSLLRRLGTTFSEDGKVLVSAKTRLFAWSLRLPIYILALWIWKMSEGRISHLIPILVLFAGITWFSYSLIRSGRFENKKRVRDCATIEVLSYDLLIVALWSILGWRLGLFFIAYPLFWFLLFNRLTWKTYITPRV